MILEKKHIFTILTKKYGFAILIEKHVSTVLMKKIEFVVLGGNTIFGFGGKTYFLLF